MSDIAAAPVILSLGEKQRLFVRLLVQFLAWALDKGYEFTLGEAKRSDEQAEINALGPQGRSALCLFIGTRYPILAQKIANNVGSGIRGSLHEISLAKDLNAFKDGAYLTKTEDWTELGEKWETLHPLCRWGGRFGDGNHLSIEHEGRK